MRKEKRKIKTRREASVGEENRAEELECTKFLYCPMDNHQIGWEICIMHIARNNNYKCRIFEEWLEYNKDILKYFKWRSKTSIPFEKLPKWFVEYLPGYNKQNDTPKTKIKKRRIIRRIT